MAKKPIPRKCRKGGTHWLVEMGFAVSPLGGAVRTHWECSKCHRRFADSKYNEPAKVFFAS